MLNGIILHEKLKFKVFSPAFCILKNIKLSKVHNHDTHKLRYVQIFGGNEIILGNEIISFINFMISHFNFFHLISAGVVEGSRVGADWLQ